MFFRDGARKQKRDLLILELSVLNNASVTGIAITLPKRLAPCFEAGYHPDKSQPTPVPPPYLLSEFGPYHVSAHGTTLETQNKPDALISMYVQLYLQSLTHIYTHTHVARDLLGANKGVPEAERIRGQP